MKKWFCAPDYSQSIRCEEADRPEGWIEPKFWSNPERTIVSECKPEDRPDGSVPALADQIAAHEDWKRSVTASREAINAECERRIFAVASDNCQRRMAAGQNRFSADDLAAYNAGLDWIDATVAACRALVAARDTTFADDTHWPACPPEAAALAARF